jgi:predicted permease
MTIRALLRRLVGPEAFSSAMVGDLEELRQHERAEHGRVRAEIRYLGRLLSIAAAFGGGHHRGIVGGTLADLRGAARRWAATPVIAVVMVASLALGIGASTAVFSVLHGVLLQPLPYASPDDLVFVRSEFPIQGGGSPRTSPPELLDLADSGLFEQVGAAWYRPGAMTDAGVEPEDVDMAFVSAGFLSTLGVEPTLGRLPTAAEDATGGPKVVVLAHATWQRRYGADPTIVGRTIAFDDVAHTVVGVLPADLRMLLPSETAMPTELAAWVPWGGGYDTYGRNWRVLTVVGRLAPGASVAATQSALDSLATELVDQHGDAYGATGFRWRIEPLDAAVVAPVRPLLLLLFAAVWLVLLVACANVANLMLARAAHDQHELTVRAALGASRWRILRQYLADCTVITGSGVAVGAALAAATVRALPQLAPAGVPRLEGVALDWQSLGYAATLAATVTLVLATLLARRGARREDTSILRLNRTTTGGAERTRQALVVAQIAFSLVLLVGAALLVQSFLGLTAVQPGFDPRGVQTMKISLVDSHYPYSNPAKIVEFYRQLMVRTAELPGVAGAGATSQLPLDGTSYAVGNYGFEAPGGALNDVGNTANYRIVTPGWLEAMRGELLRGRTLDWTDTAATPWVVVIDETLAARAWRGQNAVGQRLLLRGGLADEGRPWAEVVGVVRHMRHHPRAVGDEQIFVAHQQAPQRTMAIAVRSDLEPATLLGAVRDVVHELNAVQPLRQIRGLDSYMLEAVATTRFALDLLVATAAVALALAIIGTYGIVSFMVSRRVREIGVRMAMGASPRRVAGTVVRAGGTLVAVGVAIGVPAAFAFATAMGSLLFEVAGAQASTVLLAGTVLTLIGLAAVVVPARRAAQLSPVEALRSE